MKSNRKELIVETALELFAANGYANTPISLIARTAGIAQGLMYNFFESKEALLNEILSRGLAQVKESMEAYVVAKDPKQAIIDHIDGTFKLVQLNKNYWKLFHAIRLQNQVADFIQVHFKAGNDFILNTLTKNFKKLGYKNPRTEAKLFFATVDGVVLHYLQDEKSYSLKEIKKHLTEKYN